MRKRLLASLGALLTSTSLALSQAPAPPTLNEKIAAPAEKAGGFVLPLIPHADSTSTLASDDYHGSVTDGHAADCGKGCGPHIWASGEYLLWWVKSAPVPLVSTGNPDAAAAAALPLGALGTPGTVLLNSGQQNFGPLSGGRLTVGGWLDSDGRIGVEGSSFLMESRSNSFVARSDANGAPVIGIPAIGTPPIFPNFTESAQIFSQPGFAQGGVLLSSTVRMWGADVNGVVGVWNNDWLRLNLLAGFRYLDLAERLEMGDVTTFVPDPGFTFLFHDHFATRNQMYAGQLGGRAEVSFGKLFLNLTSKVALGTNHESIAINGNTQIFFTGAFPFAPPVAPINGGGIFAQGTNIGRRTRDEFVVAPQVRLQAGANLTENIRVFAGYEFMYMSRVVRPGDQIDRTINGTQGFGSPLIGTPRPAPLFNSSDFYANGLSAGLQISF